MTRTTKNHNTNDERTCTRREMRQAALDASEIADRMVMQAEEEDTPPDWEHITYWQRNADLYAQLALSAES